VVALTIDDGGYSAGDRAGNAQGRADAISGSDNGFCGNEHSDAYCAGYKIGYNFGKFVQGTLHNRPR